MRRIVIAVASAALLSGCYLQAGAGYYGTSYSEGNNTMVGETGGAGVGWSVTLGVELAFKSDQLVVGAGYGAAQVKSGDVMATGGGGEFDGSWRLKKLGKTGGLHVGGGFRYGGTVKAKATPAGGSEVEADGGSTFDLFGGAMLVNRGKSGRITLAAGLGIISHKSDELGKVTAFGPEMRLRYTWLPSFAPAVARGSSGPRIRTVQSGNSWVVIGEIGGRARSDARDMLMNGARNMGCTDVRVLDSQKFSATCMGSIVVGGVGGTHGRDKVAVGCPLAKGAAHCKVIFHLMIRAATR